MQHNYEYGFVTIYIATIDINAVVFEILTVFTNKVNCYTYLFTDSSKRDNHLLPKINVRQKSNNRNKENKTTTLIFPPGVILIII